MANSGSDPTAFRLDIRQILLEAQNRWLRPAEICEILRNYPKFHITPEPPFKPVSGSVFLFDRKVLRYFRKDGHNWRKKRDGKTVKEAHEKLKVGSIDVLHCYYAHGEENDNFQRRSYWMLEQDLMHIVFVHYLEVKGNKANISYTRSAEPAQSNSLDESSSWDGFPRSQNLTSENADTASPTSTLTLAHDEAESLDYTSIPSRGGGGNCADGSFTSGPQSTMDLGSWEDVFEQCTRGGVSYKQDFHNTSSVQANWPQYSSGDSPLQFHGQPIDQSLMTDISYNYINSSVDKNSLPSNVSETLYMSPSEQEEQLLQMNLQNLSSHLELQSDVDQETTMNILGHGDYSTIKQPRLGSILKEEGLKKVDSFSRWAAKELDDVEELHVQSCNGISWNVIDSEDDGSCLPSKMQLYSESLNPSLSQVQLFSIIDFSPNWAYSASETKVLITGKFLKSEREVAECKWSCMFGELEVPAEVLTDGLLRCHAPPHKPGLVPFYVTCSNRLACSEVREFEYRVGPSQEFDAANMLMTEMHLLERFQSLLSLRPADSHYSCDNPMAAKEKESMINKIMCLLEEENQRIVKRAAACDTSQPRMMEDLLHENQLKEGFYAWLVNQVSCDGKRQTVLDGEGQGVLHVAAALGYDWALKPTLESGVSVDFRDINGWTALHWAAFYGREKTVVHLVSLGASPGALTDPCAEFPLGRTPADLASANGHKGISGFLAESSLTDHLSTLTVADVNEHSASEVSRAEVVEMASERLAVPTTGQDVPDVLSFKDSLAAVRNATQAAARIHQIFRVQSFQRKQIIEHSDDDYDERALSVIVAKASRLGQNDGVAHSAALHIQKKFRGWKRRKEFLLIRKRIVKIQALVRGHQVRKKYKPIIWSVGILEKVILRWRRKGSGLRGFRSEEVTNGPSTRDLPLLEDDYDFLKEGRKQTEVRMQKALDRVKSMAQYPEARAQYRRLLTAAEGLREGKQDGPTEISKNSEDTSYHEEDLFDVEDLLDDDTFMSIAFE